MIQFDYLVCSVLAKRVVIIARSLKLCYRCKQTRDDNGGERSVWID